ncbi:MAG: hypothetical protein GWN99_16065 [Gemmatimonadetes bacterium]|nr:hypothetical protein [Gemmatimonadota bacterium]NIS02555.1 hypothetical protein [Gemmatimonadota bacterium]NIT68431.1 hypothetical protein [Gemmatimonadota bacterium]NIU51883.1 hypothetical protein [Gemmatimonadota bacterium]NIW35675.1 hypothetical protein [Gemmatimonadota bacterium]
MALLALAALDCTQRETAKQETRAAVAVSASARATERVHAVTRWDTVFAVGGAADDSTLLLPRLIAAGKGAVYAYDYGDNSVKAFDDGGRLRWRFGRRGEGPGEFMNPFDIDVGPDGTIWVLDVDAGRITHLSSEGSLLGLFRPEVTVFESLVPGNERVTIMSVSLDPFWMTVDLEGKTLAQGSAPIRKLSEIPPHLRQSLASGAASGSVWAIAFVFGDPILVYDGAEVRCRGWLVEGADFPPRQPDGPATVWAAALATTDSSVFVLARGETDKRLQLIDVYSAFDCSYQYTYVLPRRVMAMAFADGVFYFEFEDPMPVIIGLRPAS